MFVLRKDFVVLTNICSQVILPQQHSTRSGSTRYPGKIRIPPKLLVPKFENYRRQTYICPGHDLKVIVGRKCRTYIWTNIWTYICRPTNFPVTPSTSSGSSRVLSQAAPEKYPGKLFTGTVTKEFPASMTVMYSDRTRIPGYPGTRGTGTGGRDSEVCKFLRTRCTQRQRTRPGYLGTCTRVPRAL
eukprot:206594-Rhodomonas_salina.2